MPSCWTLATPSIYLKFLYLQQTTAAVDIFYRSPVLVWKLL
jgi:hypothetical protein